MGTTRRHAASLIAAVAASFVLAGCRSDGGQADGPGIPPVQGAAFAVDGETIWPLPSGIAASVETPMEELTVGGRTIENVTVVLWGITVADVVDFYEDHFASIGAVTERFDARNSAVLTVGPLGPDGGTGIVQVTGQPGRPVLVNQERSRPATDSTAAPTSSVPTSPTTPPTSPPAPSAPAPVTPSTAPPPRAPDVSSPQPAPTSAPPTPASDALRIDGRDATVDWSRATPTFEPATGGMDPHFHIYTSAAADGFYLSFEFYLVFGEAWTGQLGSYDISCRDPQLDTGICVQFDPDGSGPAGDLGEDFGARGTVVIRRLDADGYDIEVKGLAFTDGTRFADFTLAGGADDQ